MSEPDACGAGITGIVSYRLQQPYPSNNAIIAGCMHSYARVLIQNIIAVISLQTAADLSSGSFYDDLAFAVCEMSEQTGSTSETKRQMLGSQGGGRLNNSQLAIKQDAPLFLIFHSVPLANATSLPH
jgi:hypothetical protein